MNKWRKQSKLHYLKDIFKVLLLVLCLYKLIKKLLQESFLVSLYLYRDYQSEGSPVPKVLSKNSRKDSKIMRHNSN